MAGSIAVIGVGYVGLITAVGLADFGNNVTGLDIDRRIVAKLNQGTPTIFEHGLEKHLHKNLAAGRLRFSSDIPTVVRQAQIIFLAVGTPTKDNGEADLTYIDSAVDIIADNLHDFKIVVTKSTVPIGTNRSIQQRIIERSARNDLQGECAVVANPEFLREGAAIQDFFHPDRVVLGCEDQRARRYLENIYRALNLTTVPFVWCNFETAEMTKYANNTFLATKITFMNQLAHLSDIVGADIHKVAQSMGMDGRISPKFLHPGPGFGGSCLPKDTRALVAIGDRVNVDMSLVREVIQANIAQKRHMVAKLTGALGTVRGKHIALLGLTFKAGTDDIRESPAIDICEHLLALGAHVSAFDPQGMAAFAKLFANRITCFDDAFEALHTTDACMILTEWNEFRNIDLTRLKAMMRGDVIVDTRSVIDPDAARSIGLRYYGTGIA